MTQIILMTVLEPLLVELYFNNFAKYKQKYIDRIVIITNPLYVDEFDVYMQNYVKKTDSENVELLHANLIKTLEKYNIKNYIIDKNNTWGMLPGPMLHKNVSYITDDLYDVTFIDEHDAFWLNDDFNQFINDTRFKYDMIAGIKGPIFDNSTMFDDIKKFNDKYKKSYEMLYLCHLPPFIKTSILKNLDLKFDYTDKQDYSDDLDINENIKNWQLDCLQYINWQIYKKSDKVKFIPYETWDGNFRKRFDALPNITENLDEKCLFHISFASHLLKARLFLNNTEDQLINIYNNYPDIIFSRDVTFNLLNQSLTYVDFEYKDVYINNFKILNKHYNLNKFDYNNLLQKII